MPIEQKRKMLTGNRKTKTCHIPFTTQFSSESPIHESNDSAMQRFSLNFDDKIRRLLSWATAMQLPFELHSTDKRKQSINSIITKNMIYCVSRGIAKETEQTGVNTIHNMFRGCIINSMKELPIVWKKKIRMFIFPCPPKILNKAWLIRWVRKRRLCILHQRTDKVSKLS